jgi:hypothetical protein
VAGEPVSGARKIREGTVVHSPMSNTFANFLFAACGQKPVVGKHVVVQVKRLLNCPKCIQIRNGYELQAAAVRRQMAAVNGKQS